MTKSMLGKKAAVVGAGSGIGLACALRLADQGATVWAADLDPTAEAEAAFSAAGVQSRRIDVRVETQVAEFFGEAAADGLDVLVYSAGVSGAGRIDQVTEEAYDRCMDANLKGAFLCVKHSLAALSRRGGSVVTIASNAGLLPRTHDPIYCVSKAGLIMLTKALALAHARDRIRFNAVCPGPVAGTRMMENDVAQSADPEAYRAALIHASPMSSALGRMASPTEIADAVSYLCSDAAVMVTGTALQIDGGKSLGVPPRD
jgi:3-oxoacyl-[acyl-carrier protein] reductase